MRQLMSRFAIAANTTAAAASCGDVSPVGGEDAPSAEERAEAAAAADGVGGAPVWECTTETCNGLDDDCDGDIDDGLICACESPSSACYGGPPTTRRVGACTDGMQACDQTGEYLLECEGWVGPVEEVCDDGVDNDCDGQVDEDSACGPADASDPDADPPPGPHPAPTVTVELDLEGDCVTVSCPEAAPYPVGCDVRFHGGDSRGCVASEPDRSRVYFQEGNVCNAGRLQGQLFCSSTPAAVGLTGDNCPINKRRPMYVSNRRECPVDEE